MTHLACRITALWPLECSHLTQLPTPFSCSPSSNHTGLLPHWVAHPKLLVTSFAFALLLRTHLPQASLRQPAFLASCKSHMLPPPRSPPLPKASLVPCCHLPLSYYYFLLCLLTPKNRFPEGRNPPHLWAEHLALSVLTWKMGVI
jgi:hypothetical protein